MKKKSNSKKLSAVLWKRAEIYHWPKCREQMLKSHLRQREHRRRWGRKNERAKSHRIRISGVRYWVLDKTGNQHLWNCRKWSHQQVLRNDNTGVPGVSPRIHSIPSRGDKEQAEGCNGRMSQKPWLRGSCISHWLATRMFIYTDTIEEANGWFQKKFKLSHLVLGQG